MDTKTVSILVVAILVVAGISAALVLAKDDGDASRNLDVNLEIYGNADGDWKVDENDAKLVESWIDANENNDTAAIDELKGRINLDFADANRSGAIDSKDVEQIRAIANGTAKHLWFLDGIQQEREMDIGDAIKKVGCEYYSNTEAMLILGQADRIAAVDNAPYQYLDFYFSPQQKSKVTNMVNMNAPDYGFVNTLKLDVLLIFSSTASYEAKQEKLIGTDVLYLGLYNPDLTNTAKSNFIQGILKAGYIFGAVDRAVDYTNWVLDYRGKMLDIANSIPDEKKPVCAMSNYTNSYFENGTSNTIPIYSSIDPLGQAVVLSGGKNLLQVLDVTTSGYSHKIGIDAVFNKHPVDHFFLHNVKYTYGGAVMSSTPDHGYLQDDPSQMADAWKKSVGQPLMGDETVTLLAGDFRNGCTGGILLAAYMAKQINPDAYSGIDPLKMHAEYIDWMGISDYDITKHGVFFYQGQAA